MTCLAVMRSRVRTPPGPPIFSTRQASVTLGEFWVEHFKPNLVEKMKPNTRDMYRSYGRTTSRLRSNKIRCGTSLDSTSTGFSATSTNKVTHHKQSCIFDPC